MGDKLPQSQKERIMKALGVSEAEAEEIIAYDKAIDRGERGEYDLTPEQEKEAKKFANVKEHKRPTVYKFDKLPRKENTTKKGIIDELFKFLQENTDTAYENVNILNKERQIAFTVGADTFELTLVQKRKPKN